MVQLCPSVFIVLFYAYYLCLTVTMTLMFHIIYQIIWSVCSAVVGVSVCLRVTGGELFEDIVAREYYSEADAR